MADGDARLTQQDERGRRIDALMRELEVDAVLQHLRQQLLEAVLQTAPADDGGRARLHAAARAVDALRGHIRQAIVDGAFARRALRELRSGRRGFF
jgi:hypothetical protein